MIHEALFYLLSTDSPNEEKYEEVSANFFVMFNLFILLFQWINSSEMQKFLHPGERKILQRIANVAVKYQKIQKFIKSVTDLEDNTENSSCKQYL